ncbi:HTTM domain-containing protein [Ferruginibacter albus]|uniref:HTTM domain-containing protein n=1 Tax=Ferruginibacter albus TaxID=2875540 RepID=UPI001CC43BDE|nr:HTTM domain-containing protein [Ferruginibacter albus]UAY51511.1 HTTM domain-containing protein [Ferruginibacter albus]
MSIGIALNIVEPVLRNEGSLTATAYIYSTRLNQKIKNIINKYFFNPAHIAPLVVFRIIFGIVLFISTLRFICKGWITEFYVKPKFHFPFYGFEWIHPLSSTGMYTLYALLLVTAFFIIVGLFYRIATIVFFVCFCYAELIDKTYYLNHYYLVSILVFLLILTPANKYFSIDALRKPSLKAAYIPAWCITVFKLQLFIIYFYAGLSKLIPDWLFNAMPLKIWLRANDSLPIIGHLLSKQWVAYLFSWFGALFDLSIVFLLWNKSTRKIAYVFVIIFHLITTMLFQIGMFPYIMIAAATIFFSEAFHKKIIRQLQSIFKKTTNEKDILYAQDLNIVRKKTILLLLSIYFLIQVLVPLRFLLYPGKLLWTEQGYRFSWRVMLMEKAGTTFFYITNPETGKRLEVNNSKFLTGYQERMMETQPDMMLQYAHILNSEYKKQGITYPVVTVECYVSLNGTGNRLYIDSTINLANEQESWFGNKKWILP